MCILTSLGYRSASQISTKSPDFKHTMSVDLLGIHDSLWIHGWYNPSLDKEQSRRLEMQPQSKDRELLAKEKQKQIHHKAQEEEKLQDDTSLLALLKACAKQKDLCKGSRIHADILKRGLLEKDIHVGTTLINMYVKCGAFAKAQEVFDELPVRDVVTWNLLIAGYARYRRGHEALNCLEQMQKEGLSPNTVTFTSVLKACGSVGATEKGKEIHAEINRQGLLGESIMLGNSLVDMYAKTGALVKAKEVFDELPIRNVATWNALITGYSQHGHGVEALDCFERMQYIGLSPNAVTFTCALKACSSIGAAKKGEELHAEIIRLGLLEDVMLGTALVDMFSKCGALAKAQEVFDGLPVRNVVSWNALIAGYAQLGHGCEALNCFEQMQHEGISPNAVTFTEILKACGSIGAAEEGEKIHAEVVKQGWLKNDFILGTALVDMYAKCGALAKAQEVFDELPHRDVVSWSALIEGYAKLGHGDEALNCYERMQDEGLFPTAITFMFILKACSSIGAAEKGKEVHSEVVRHGLLGKNIMLGNALVEFYAKCGALAKAQEVFDKLPARDVVTWSALIAGYAQHGHTDEALNCFERMQDESLTLDAVTFTVLLNACSHSGLMDVGQMFFQTMSTGYGILPTLEHHTCMIDLFGRAGRLDKAIGLIEKTPLSDRQLLWFALLGACRKWGNLKLGRVAFENIVQLDKMDAAAYVCMSNIYAAAGMQEEADKVEAMRVRTNAVILLD